MNKEELIEFVKTLPDDIQVFTTDKDNYGCVDVRIFTEPKSEEFYDWYFAP